MSKRHLSLATKSLAMIAAVVALASVSNAADPANADQHKLESIRKYIPRDFKFPSGKPGSSAGYWIDEKDDDLLGHKVVHLLVSPDGQALEVSLFGQGAGQSVVVIFGRLKETENMSSAKGTMFTLSGKLTARTDSELIRDDKASSDYVLAASDEMILINPNGRVNMPLRRRKVEP